MVTLYEWEGYDQSTEFTCHKGHEHPEYLEQCWEIKLKESHAERGASVIVLNHARREDMERCYITGVLWPHSEMEEERKLNKTSFLLMTIVI